MALPAILGLVGAVAKPLLANLFPDPEQRAKAELKLLELQQQGALKEVEVAMSAIVMEAKSADKWTSRARPGFLYVIYLYIIAAIPMGVLHAADPMMSANVTLGVQGWLAAIPEAMWWLFGAGYLGYSGARTMDKKTLAQGFKS